MGVLVLFLYLTAGYIGGISRAILEKNKEDKFFFVILMTISCVAVIFCIRTAGHLADNYNVNLNFEVFSGVLACILMLYVFNKKKK